MSEAVKSVYAKALLEASQEGKCGGAVLEDLLALCEILRQTPQLQKFFCVPVIDKQDKQRMADSLFQGKIHPYTLNFLKTLIEAERFSEFVNITEEFQELYNHANGIERVKVFTARPLSVQQEARLKEKAERMTGRRVQMEVNVDPGLIGGLVVDIGGKRFDNSLKSRLAQLGDAVSRSVFQKKGE